MKDLTFALISLASPIFLFLLIKFILQKQWQNTKIPPSPPSLPIIGHLHLLKGPLHRVLMDLSEKYGSLYTLQMGFRRVLVISSPSAIKEIFSKYDIIFANRPKFAVGEHLNYDFTTVGAAPYGELWKNLRRLFMQEMSSATRLNTYVSVRLEEICLLLKNLFRESNQCEFVKAEIRSKLSDLSFNIVMRMVTGKRYFGVEVENYEEAKQFRDIVKEVFELSGASNPGDFMSCLRWIDYGGLEKRMLTLRKKADDFLQSMMDKHREENRNINKDEGIKKTMMDSMLSLQETEPEYYTDDIIKGTILTMIGAGTDTTTGTIEWAMSLLVNHPEVLAKARDELDFNIKEVRLVEEKEIANLPYLQNIVNETLRLYPIAPLLSPHESSAPTTIGGYDFPHGTMLLVNAWAIHRDPQLWEDPMSFKPERFEGNGGEGFAYKFIPFGLGRRRCPGSGLANRVVGLALATLIQCFEWERIGDDLVDMSEVVQGIAMPRAVPLEVMCKARERMIAILSEL